MNDISISTTFQAYEEEKNQQQQKNMKHNGSEEKRVKQNSITLAGLAYLSSKLFSNMIKSTSSWKALGRLTKFSIF